MRNRTVVIFVLAGLIALCAPSRARAQQALGQTASQAGWSFNIAPYLWLPTINTTLDYNLPPQLGGRLPTDVSAGPGDYLSKLNFATMFAAEARYDRFSIMTDFTYMNVSTGASHVTGIDFFGLPPELISRSLETSISTTLKASIWTLAGGYTVAQGSWGNLDALVGFRYLGVNARTDYSLALTITGPRGNGATFGGIGDVSGATAIWNGIAGVRGRIRLGTTGLFIPYYFDIGAGGSNLTWQIASGLGYQTGWAGVSLTYRYMSFEQPSSFVAQHLGLGGPMLMVNFDF